MELKVSNLNLLLKGLTTRHLTRSSRASHKVYRYNSVASNGLEMDIIDTQILSWSLMQGT
jgi:hypothetical protein